MRLEEYKESGILPPSALLSGVLSGLITAGIFGPLYATIIYHNPFIYLSVLATGLFGMIMGISVGVGMRDKRSRNKKANIGVALIMTAFAYALSWVVWMGWMLHGLEGFTWAAYLGGLKPSELLGWIGAFHEHGAWSLSRRSAEPVRGHMLTVIWSLEALIIFGLAAFSASIQGGVFCERCKAWLEPSVSILGFEAPGNEERIESRLRMGDFSFLSEVRPVTHNAKVFYSLHIAACETCRQTNALSLIRHGAKLDGSKAKESEDTPILKDLIMSEAQLYDLRARMSTYREVHDLGQPGGSGDERMIELDNRWG